MYTSVKGIYENGTLTLLEPAPKLDKSEVLVTFLSEESVRETGERKPGGLLRLRHPGDVEMSIPDDFNAPLEDLKDHM